MNYNTEQYFSSVPNVDVPRSVFDRSFNRKQVINVDYLYPIFLDEALPGDSLKLSFNMFGRLINPLVAPTIDELFIETFWFSCPCRILWSNWKRMWGEQDNPDDSIDYLVPTVNSGETGQANMTLWDFFALPTQVADFDVNALPFRFYNKTYNEWFRDENLIDSVEVPLTDSDDITNYQLLKSAKPHDYFTSCLPFAQKFGEVLLPLGESAPVVPDGTNPTAVSADGVTQPLTVLNDSVILAYGGSPSGLNYVNTGFETDLSSATSATVNDIRFAFQLQKYREKLARGGSRYPELIKANYGVTSPDFRQQRVEFLGSTRDMIDINTVIQTSSSDDTSPQGNLAAFGVVGNKNYAFSASFTEHSLVMGLVRICHNPLYQYGCNKLWKRQTSLDYYIPSFAFIGEQPVYNYELYAQGNTVLDDDGVTPVDELAFGFNEAWADYRYHPNEICGKLRSNDAQSLDYWHFGQEFSELPVLNQSFIDSAIPIERSIAVSDEPQFLLDFRYNYKCARPMPVRSVPGLIDHF